MEIKLVRCLADCDHIESDTSLEAAKRRIIAHMAGEHGLTLIDNAKLAATLTSGSGGAARTTGFFQ